MSAREERFDFDGDVIGSIQADADAVKLDGKWGFGISNIIPRSGRFATNLITFTGVGVADETIVIAGVTYTFVAAPTDPYDVDIKVSATTQATALVNAINADGTAGAYATGTLAHPTVEAVQYAGDLVMLKARTIGSNANSYAVTAPGTSTNFSVVASFSGGLDGTPGATGQMLLAGNTMYECAKNQSWRTPSNYWHCDFVNGVNLASFENDYTAAVGTDNAVNMHIINSSQRLYSTNIGTQTIISPTSVEGTGLLCSLDITDTEGVEYNLEGDGTTGTPLGMQFTVGSVPAFFIRATFKLTLVAQDEMFIGFRKLEAHQNAIASYAEVISIGNIDGDVITHYEKGGSSDADATGDLWAATETHSLMVAISDNGTASYFFDDVNVTAEVSAASFDGGEVVIPFIRIIHNANPGAIHLLDLECGPYKG